MNTTDRRTSLKLMGTPALAAAWPAIVAGQMVKACDGHHRTIDIAGHVETARTAAAIR